VTDPVDARAIAELADRIADDALMRAEKMARQWPRNSPRSAIGRTVVRLHQTASAFRHVADLVRTRHSDRPFRAKLSAFAVPEAYRNQGRAKEAISAAISELQHGFGRTLPAFYVEAIVRADNKSSQSVAQQVISDTPVAVTDQLSGLPAFQYLRRIDQPTAPNGG
jgi:RimJ/RimL family protein N-acetyltransferase